MNIQPTVSGSGPARTTTTKLPAKSDKVEVKSDKAPEVQPALTAKEAVKRVENFVSQKTNEINFSIDRVSGIEVVKIIDRTSKDVIRQMPSEEMIAIAQALDKLQGLFVRDKV